MSSEAGHVQISEFSKEAIPTINWMMEDLFCQYGVSIPYFMIDFDFPDYSQRPDWVTYSPPEWYLPEWKAYWPTYFNQWPTEWSGYNFNLDWGPWGYWLPWFNEMLGILFDEAGLPRWQMPDFSEGSIDMLNTKIEELYVKAAWTIISRESGDNILPRSGDGPTYAEAKTEYEDDPLYSNTLDSGDLYVNWWQSNYPSLGDRRYDIIANNSYVKFDTSSISYIYGAKIVISGMTITTTGWDSNLVLQIYEYDYTEPFGSGDWDGGTKIAEVEIPAGEADKLVNISIANDKVNTGGYSKYRFTLKSTTDLNYPSVPDDNDWKELRLTATAKLYVR